MYKLLLASCIVVTAILFASQDTMKTDKTIVIAQILDTTQLNVKTTLQSVNNLIIKYDQNEQAIGNIQNEINKIIALLDSLNIINIEEYLNYSNTKSDTIFVPILSGGAI